MGHTRSVGQQVNIIKNRWVDQPSDPIMQRIYTSRLYGLDPRLVLHGGGNTSVKITVPVLGESVSILFVKGSGHDMATIQANGFSPVQMEVLKMMLDKQLTDELMMKTMRAAMIDPDAPHPSVEALTHAVIPAKYVDHTHASAVVALSNTPVGKEHLDVILGGRCLTLPYVMPGFQLAKQVDELLESLNSRGIDYNQYLGIILMSHGVFTWGETAKEAYDKHIEIASTVHNWVVEQNKAKPTQIAGLFGQSRPEHSSFLRKELSKRLGKPVLTRLNQEKTATEFAAHRSSPTGPLTPDHVIRTKAKPLWFWTEEEFELKTPHILDTYEKNYRDYFNEFKEDQVILDPVPRWIIWEGIGSLTIGASRKELEIVSDIVDHTMQTVWDVSSIPDQQGKTGYTPLPQKQLFEVEYWSLEQAKLKKLAPARAHEGKVAIVTGAASGIGKATVLKLANEGAIVFGVDKDEVKAEHKNIHSLSGVDILTADWSGIMGIITRAYGGVDIMVLSAGSFPKSTEIEHMDKVTWDYALRVNLTAQMNMIKEAIPVLKNGVDPTIIIIGSKNVEAPGMGQVAYSVTKAGSTQLARVAALELAKYGIRVNVIHPDAVFDTGLWSAEILAERAAFYNMTVEEYKTRNLLKTEIKSTDVAELVHVLIGPAFVKTTGAQIPIDGGNDRVI